MYLIQTKILQEQYDEKRKNQKNCKTLSKPDIIYCPRTLQGRGPSRRIVQVRLPVAVSGRIQVTVRIQKITQHPALGLLSSFTVQRTLQGCGPSRRIVQVHLPVAKLSKNKAKMLYANKQINKQCVIKHRQQRFLIISNKI